MPMTLADVFFRPIEPGRALPADLADGGSERHHDAYPKGSSEWWLARLLHEMRERNDRLVRLRSYYEGTNETWRFANEAHRETFGVRFHNLRANYARPIVEITAQRMSVDAVVIEGDDDGSDEAWRIWQANRLDARSLTAHLNVLSVGECPVIVGPNVDDAGTPRITVEDPLQVIVETDPADQGRAIAGLKMWEAERHTQMAVLYLPDRIEWWTSDEPKPGKPRTWLPVPDRVQQNPWGIVPIVVLENAPTRRAEHEDVLDQLDLYAKTLYDMTTASDYMASPQRWATGVTIADEGQPTDADGNPTATDASGFKGGPNRVWTSDDPDSSFGQLPAADLTAFVRQLEAYRSDMATITHTPHRLLIPPPSSVPPSGESVRLADSPLTKKVGWKTTAIGDGWEEVVRLAFLIAGDTARARRMDLEVVWADPELQSETVRIDALSKMAAMGVPETELWRRMGATPQQIRRWKAANAAYGDYISPEERATLIEEVKAGIRTEDEARAVLKLAPMEWSEDLTKDEIASIIEQVKAGLLTETEARELMKRPPIEWSDDPSPDEIASLVAQVKEGLATIEEARAILGRPPVEWPEDLSEKVTQAEVLIRSGFDPQDVLANLGLPPIRHLGLPPTSIQKPADAAGVQPAPAPDAGVPLPEVKP